MSFPVFLHVFGAMLLVGTLLTVALALLLDWRRADGLGGLTRLGLRTMLIAVVPAYLLMRVGAEWAASRANVDDDWAWITIGYITADAGVLVVLVSLVLAALALRKLRSGGGRGPARAVGVLSTLLLAVYVVTVWAMSTKPL